MNKNGKLIYTVQILSTTSVTQQMIKSMFLTF